MLHPLWYARGELESLTLKDINAAELVIKMSASGPQQLNREKVCQVPCMICLINFHYKVFINLFLLLRSPDDCPLCVCITARRACLRAQGVVSWYCSPPTGKKKFPWWENFMCGSGNCKRACFLIQSAFISSGELRRISRRSNEGSVMAHN